MLHVHCTSRLKFIRENKATRPPSPRVLSPKHRRRCRNRRKSPCVCPFYAPPPDPTAISDCADLVSGPFGVRVQIKAHRSASADTASATSPPQIRYPRAIVPTETMNACFNLIPQKQAHDQDRKIGQRSPEVRQYQRDWDTNQGKHFAHVSPTQLAAFPGPARNRAITGISTSFTHSEVESGQVDHRRAPAPSARHAVSSTATSARMLNPYAPPRNIQQPVIIHH